MFYRIIALFALFFFTACAGTDMQPQTRKSANRAFAAPRYDGPPSEAITMAEPAAPVPLKVVKIGLLIPLSGNAGEVGTALMDAATLALMDKYGTIENDRVRVKVVLVPKDTQGTPEGARKAAEHVLNSGAELIVGPLFSQNVEAIKPMAEQYGVNILTFSNNTEIAGGGVFVFGFLVEQQVKRIVNYALNNNLRQIGLLAPETPYGLSVQQSMGEVLARSGMSPAAQELYKPALNAASEIEELAVAASQKPLQALLIPEGGQKLLNVAQGLGQRGMNLPGTRLLGTGIWDEPEVLRAGVLTGGWFASSSPERFAAYERRFRDYFGYPPPRISALGYDAMALSASLALSPHGENFSVNAITDPVGYNGPVNGIFRCERNGICERGLAVMEVTDYGAKIIDPAPQAFDVPSSY